MGVPQGIHHPGDRPLDQLGIIHRLVHVVLVDQVPGLPEGRKLRLQVRRSAALVWRLGWGWCLKLKPGLSTGTKFPTTKPLPKRQTTRTTATTAMIAVRKDLFSIWISQ